MSSDDENRFDNDEGDVEFNSGNEVAEDSHEIDDLSPRLDVKVDDHEIQNEDDSSTG